MLKTATGGGYKTICLHQLNNNKLLTKCGKPATGKGFRLEKYLELLLEV